ncbi:MAG: hypothetical protein JWN65_3498 [Solirubrobacterales bacterium]|nr:hypothetical protein [Solirubrobacterales bacterium]
MRMPHLLTPVAALATLAALSLPTGASAAKFKDRDHDRMPDKWEVAHKLNPKKSDARKDADKDGLKNLAEYRAHTNPRDADTDDDGLKDGREQAGTIASFQNGVLTLTLFDGSTLIATVNDRTKVECADAAPAPTPTAAATRSRHDAGDDDDQDDDHGDRRHDDGDDQNDDHGDDHGDDENACGAADLKAGARVDEADVSVTSAGRVFTKIELG